MIRSTLTLATLSLAVVLGCGTATAANSQHDEMESCSNDAKTTGLKGDDRKTFMKTCLSSSATPAPAATNSQQEKMKTCSADAKTKGLKGDDRKKFMSDCLKG